jgi:hypothetical protein
MTTLPIIQQRRTVRLIKRIVGILLLAIVLACVLVSCGCNASPTQAYGAFSLFTFDNRTYYEVVGNVTNEVARPGGGHGSNSRLYSDHIQGMVLYKSPSSASSNSTDVTASLPLLK